MSDIREHDVPGEEEGGESFAELFERSEKRSRWIEPGQKMTAQVLKVSAEWIFIDVGQKGEGVVDRKEFLDLDGNVTVREGDAITVYFLSSSHGEMRFTSRIGAGSGGGGNTQLEDAWKSGVPVEGVVEKEIKGGFEIKLGGSARAFCPYSQIALRRLDDPASLIGTRLPFRITDYAENGRNIVVSRRTLLEEEQQRLKEAAHATLEVGMTVTGTVLSLQDFGAFVDIGGLEGLIPVSEIGWTRVKHVSEVLSVGQQVKVVVKSIDREKDRIALSLKDTLADPWDAAVQQFPDGSFHTGCVSRLAPFGAFVTLAPGIDGLIHISKLGGGKRINHPREVIKEGDSVEVKIEGCDRSARRISLSLAGVARAAEEEEATLEEFRRQSADAPKGMGTLGDLLQARLNKGKR